ncbi:family 43 glycosylhydrolase [Saccharicrinis sp. FJH62]|uniref:family 43 glycosylhydrolase n=1 Tax=Saccharicrinis sp. FJH62 TaxID=3344657 RepID=UPI0035D4769C
MKQGILSIVVVLIFYSFSMLAQGYFTNPISTFDNPDPYVIQKDGNYYYCATYGNGVTIRKSNQLQEIGKAKGFEVWNAANTPEVAHTIWAPELHYINGKWYIYTCGKPCSEETNTCEHQIIVLEGTTQNPQDPFVFKGYLAHGIDGTVIQKDGELYFVWMRHENGTTYHISIAPMLSPIQLGSPTIRISRDPFYDWETHDQYCNEGPAILYRGDKVIIIYSASASWTQWYSLGMFSNDTGNLLDAASWIKSPTPLFQKSDKNRIYSTGHCSFTKSPDGREDWILFHAKTVPDNGWDGRKPHLQQFTWDENDNPVFGEPLSVDTRIPIPSSDNRKHQTITFAAINTKNVTDEDFTIHAESSSELPVFYLIKDGPASVSGNTVSLTGKPGKVVIAAYQLGNDTLNAAPETLQSFSVRDPDMQWGNGDGLKAYYYSGTDFNSYVFKRIDPEINFDWGAGSPGNGVPNDNFSVRWRGYVQPLFSETYTFYITSDNGRRLKIGNTTLVNKWLEDWGFEYSNTVKLTAGEKVPIEVDFFSATGDANINLYWSSASNPKRLVPQSQLYSELGTSASDKISTYAVFNVFPNPSNGSFHLSFPDRTAKNITILDLAGKTVYQNKGCVYDKIQINLPPSTSRGIYLLKVTNDDQSMTTKFFIK